MREIELPGIGEAIDNFGRFNLDLFSFPYSEPPRDCRRPFGLSYAAMAVSSSMA
jgi:hypothetical protein